MRILPLTSVGFGLSTKNSMKSESRFWKDCVGEMQKNCNQPRQKEKRSAGAFSNFLFYDENCTMTSSFQKYGKNVISVLKAFTWMWCLLWTIQNRYQVQVIDPFLICLWLSGSGNTICKIDSLCGNYNDRNVQEYELNLCTS